MIIPVCSTTQFGPLRTINRIASETAVVDGHSSGLNKLSLSEPWLRAKYVVIVHATANPAITSRAGRFLSLHKEREKEGMRERERKPKPDRCQLFVIGRSSRYRSALSRGCTLEWWIPHQPKYFGLADCVINSRDGAARLRHPGIDRLKRSSPWSFVSVLQSLQTQVNARDYDARSEPLVLRSVNLHRETASQDGQAAF